MARNGPFVRLIAAYFINGLSNGIPATLFLYFVSERLGAPDMRGPLLFIYFLAGLIGVPFAIRLAGRVGKHRAWCYAMLLNSALFALVPLLGEGDAAWFAAICFGTGLTVGADLALPSAIQADVIDVDTARSGEQRSGLYFATWSLSTKAVAGARRRHHLSAARPVRLRPGAGRGQQPDCTGRADRDLRRDSDGAEARGDRADVEFPARRDRAARIARRDRDEGLTILRRWWGDR